MDWGAGGWTAGGGASRSCFRASWVAGVLSSPALGRSGWGLRRAVATGQAQSGVLLRPASVAQIEATAHGGERMPPKTTFFHPKPKTGLAFRDLD